MIFVRGGIKRKIRNVFYGQAIECLEDHQTYRVEEIYPYYVIGCRKAKSGAIMKHCFTYGELIQRGLEEQEPIYEALREKEKMPIKTYKMREKKNLEVGLW